MENANIKRKYWFLHLLWLVFHCRQYEHKIFHVLSGQLHVICKYTSFHVIQTCDTFQKSLDSKAFTTITTLKRRLGTEDTKWWSVSGVILSHSSCKQVLRWATVWGLRCQMRHTFSIGDRSGLQAGQSSTHTLFLRSQDFVMCAECGFALSCWNMHVRPWKRCLLEGSILCSKIFYVLFSIMVPSQKWSYLCQGQPYHDRTLAFGLVAGNSLDDPFLLWSGAHGVHSSQKIPEILIQSDHSTHSTVWWSIPDASEPREVDGASGHCILDVTTYCGTWQRFAKVVLSPCGDIAYRWMTILDAVPPEGSEITVVQLRLAPLSFMHWNSSRFLESFNFLTYLLANWRSSAHLCS